MENSQSNQSTSKRATRNGTASPSTYEWDKKSRANPEKVLPTLIDILRGKEMGSITEKLPVCDRDQRELGYQKIVEEFGEPYHRQQDQNGQIQRVTPNERHFAARIIREGEIIHEPSEGFYQYDRQTGLWQAVTESRIAQYVADIVRAQAEYDGCKKLELKITDKFQKAVVSQAKGIGEKRDYFSNPPEAVHVQNGMFVVREGGELEFLEGGFSPDFRSRSRCEIPYNPDATCPKTERDLVLFNLSPEDAKIYWQYAGLCLLGRNFTRRICIIHGLASGTGKTQLINLVQHLIGLNNAVELRTEMLHQKHETDRCVNKTLLVGPDVDSDFLSVKSAQVLLRLTGGDILTPEGKFQSGRQAKNIFGNFAVMISSNNYLRVKEGVATDPWRNRLLLLEALGNIPRIKIDRFAERLLHQEAAGILNRAVQGLKELLKSANTGEPFKLQPAQKNRIEALLCSSDSVRLYLEECLQLEKGANATTEELVGAYFAFCKKQGWPPRPRVDQLIKDALREVHALNEQNSISRNDKDKRGFRGIRIKAGYASEVGQMGQVFETL